MPATTLEIYAYLIRMMRDADLAADLAQDTFIRAYRAIDSLEDRGRRGLAHQIAHRIALDEIRHRRIVRFLPLTRRVPRRRALGRASGHGDAAIRPLARALALIPERQRNALLMAEVGDLTAPELAEALGVSHVAARALLTRARESLRASPARREELEKEREAGSTLRLPRRPGAPIRVAGPTIPRGSPLNVRDRAAMNAVRGPRESPLLASE